MEPMTTLPLAKIKQDDPPAYDYIQTLIRATIRRSPAIVKALAAQGVAGESLHEALEGLLEKGLLRYRVEEDPATRDLIFHLQVYDIQKLAYRDVGMDPRP